MKQISVTERSSWKSCRQYHDFGYTQMLTHNTKSIGPLWFGTGIHVALATYYKFGESPRRSFERWFYSQFTQDEYNSMMSDEQDRVLKFRDLGLSMMTDYPLFAEQNDNWDVIGVEEPLRYEVLPEVELVGSLDMLVRDRRTRKLWIVDHKTCASFIDPEALVFDDQMSTYLWIVWKVYKEVPGGAIYSMLRKAVPSEPVLLKDGTRFSKAAGQDTTPAKLRAAIERHNFNPLDYAELLNKLESNQFFRREYISKSSRELAIFDSQIVDELKDMSDPNRRVYPTMTQDCLWSCDYRDLCRTKLTGGDVNFTIAANFRTMTRQERYLERWLGPESPASPTTT